VTIISPGFTVTELTHFGGDPAVQNAVRERSQAVGITPSAVAAAIGYAISQPDDVDVSEIVIQPTAQT
jgi:NADP-dependent 3-hydroxy acid dehydrogenase YdfG